MFYVYLHRRADTGAVFYVGKGRDRRAWSRKNRNSWWKSIVAKHGYTVEVVAEYASEAHAFEYERCAVAMYRAAGVELCNLTDGGEGPSGLRHSAETRAKMSAAKSTPEARENLACANRSRVWTHEARAKLGAACKGRHTSAHQKLRVSETHAGVPKSVEQRARMSAAAFAYHAKRRAAAA